MPINLGVRSRRIMSPRPPQAKAAVTHSLKKKLKHKVWSHDTSGKSSA
jgi:hypothetical protein